MTKSGRKSNAQKSHRKVQSSSVHNRKSVNKPLTKSSSAEKSQGRGVKASQVRSSRAKATIQKTIDSKQEEMKRENAILESPLDTNEESVKVEVKTKEMKTEVLLLAAELGGDTKDRIKTRDNAEAKDDTKAKDTIAIKDDTETKNNIKAKGNTVANSVNLTDVFSTGFTRVDILDNSANNLLAVQGQSLYRIDVGAKRISEPLLQNVIDYDHLGNEIAYVISKAVTPAEQIADPATSGVADESISPTTTTAYEIGTLRIGSDEPKVLSLASKPARILISRFYDEKYLTVVSESDVTVYYENDFSEMLSRQLSFVPNAVKIGHNGEFCTFISDEKIATLDMEAQGIREWNLDSVHFGWLDDDMIYAVAGGVLSVYDYDGLNRRTLAQNVSVKYPATIASNNKWLYYVSDNTLVREIVAD